MNIEQRREALELATKVTTNPSDLIAVAREIAAFLFDDASASARAAAEGKRQKERIYGKMTQERKELAAYLMTSEPGLSYRKVISRINELPGPPVAIGSISRLVKALGLPPREQSPKVQAMLRARGVHLARKNALAEVAP